MLPRPSALLLIAALALILGAAWLLGGDVAPSRAEPAALAARPAAILSAHPASDPTGVLGLPAACECQVSSPDEDDGSPEGTGAAVLEAPAQSFAVAPVASLPSPNPPNRSPRFLVLCHFRC